MSRFDTHLRILYGLLVLGCTIFSGIYVHQHAIDFTTVTAGSVAFLEHTFFLVVLLHLFFLPLYMLQHAPSAKTLVALIVGPILASIAGYFFVHSSFGFFFAQMGMVIVIELTCGFALLMLVITAGIVAGAMQSRKITDLSGLLIVVMQGLFLIPGIGAAWIFGNAFIVDILPATVPDGPYRTILLIAVYASWLIPVAQNIYAIFGDFKNESIIA